MEDIPKDLYIIIQQFMVPHYLRNKSLCFSLVVLQQRNILNIHYFSGNRKEANDKIKALKTDLVNCQHEAKGRYT